jgi:hypothetical protein
MQMEQEI